MGESKQDSFARFKVNASQRDWLRRVIEDWQLAVAEDPVCHSGRHAENLQARFSMLIAHLSIAATLHGPDFDPLAETSFGP